MLVLNGLAALTCSCWPRSALRAHHVKSKCGVVANSLHLWGMHGHEKCPKICLLFLNYYPLSPSWLTLQFLRLFFLSIVVNRVFQIYHQLFYHISYDNLSCPALHLHDFSLFCFWRYSVAPSCMWDLLPNSYLSVSCSCAQKDVIMGKSNLLHWLLQYLGITSELPKTCCGSSAMSARCLLWS